MTSGFRRQRLTDVALSAPALVIRRFPSSGAGRGTSLRVSAGSLEGSLLLIANGVEDNEFLFTPCADQRYRMTREEVEQFAVTEYTDIGSRDNFRSCPGSLSFRAAIVDAC